MLLPSLKAVSGVEHVFVPQSSRTQTSNIPDPGLKTATDKCKSKEPFEARNSQKTFVTGKRQKPEKLSLKVKTDVRKPAIPLWAKTYPDDGQNLHRSSNYNIQLTLSKVDLLVLHFKQIRPKSRTGKI
jgi:hypothetical protein